MDWTEEIDEILKNTESPFRKMDEDTRAQFCELARSDWKKIVAREIGHVWSEKGTANLIKFLEKCDELSRGIFIMMCGLQGTLRQLKEEVDCLKKENTMLRQKVRDLKTVRHLSQ